jgi:hypothetical protein
MQQTGDAPFVTARAPDLSHHLLLHRPNGPFPVLLDVVRDIIPGDATPDNQEE